MTVASPPERKPDRIYDFRKTNKVFAFSALAFLAITLLMVMNDFGRPWKRTQAEFRGLERAAITADLEAEKAAIDQQQMAAVQAEIEAEQASLATAEGEMDALREELAIHERSVFEDDKTMRAYKSQLDAAKYELDAAINQDGDIEAAEARVEELTANWIEYTKLVQRAQTERDRVQSEIDSRQAALNASRKKLDDLNGALSGLELRLSTVEKNLDYFLLNAPLMDFLAPSLQIEQVVLKGLYHDINFAKIDRVDRCVTCHLASARQGFDGEQWEPPFRSHPRLDLFVADSSPHPYGQFGCTSCHAGLDRATDFARAGHSPVDEVQKAQWVADYDWEAQKYLETPIKPPHLSESGCISCHSDEVWTPQSQVVDLGRQVIVKAGCYGCHRIGYEAFENMPRIGPDLRKVASKLEPAFASKWLEAPRDFRPTTWMPHFFYQENIAGDLNLARQRAEIEAITDFLWDISDRPEYPPAPSGNAQRGEQLFYEVGCAGCHLVDPDAKREDYLDSLYSLHGPNLAGVGSKTDAGWMYAWIKNPKQYREDTSMPNLRLTDREAADIVAFLGDQRQPGYDSLEREPVDAAVRQELVESYFRTTMTIEQSAERASAMSAEEQSVYLGEQTVAKYGCFSCHTITGYEDMKPIGVELTEEASKPLHLFDFGHQHDLPHTHQAWLGQKIQHPRSFDHGKELVLNYDELSRMPDFGFTDRERDVVLANVLGFTKESVLEERKAGQGERGEKLGAGRKLVTRYNCQGCHMVEGKGQAIRPFLLDENNLPPDLAALGHRVQSDWLFEFLGDPSTVRTRPWLQARMPTFEFSDEEANTLVEYFAAADHRSAFAYDPEPGPERERVVGEQVFNMLQCAKCHPSGPGAAAAAGAADSELAPSLLLAVERLRHDWVPEWIKDPQSFIPGTKMPTNFPLQNGEYQSFVDQAINQPTYAAEKARMLRYFDSEEDLLAYLNDVDAVSRALRDYIWTLSN